MPHNDADRDLLFGLLALQTNLIDSTALVAAFHDWTSDKSRPMGAILETRGTLNSSRRALIEALVEEHLAQHEDDPRQSLAALSSIGSTRRGLAEVPDAELHVSLAHVSEAWETQVPDADRPGVVKGPTSTGSRFRILRPHAKGGLGVVSVALDEELGREVALKEIQDRHADHPESRARFVLEAEITGGLEHPGIVPVYGLGHYAEGRPYYAMRFIRGDSLHDAIKRFHADESLKADPGERTLALQKLLRRFLDVCDAIDYAHSRGVLHRDLKPGNVMVGNYGETLVVDWGLAKPMGRSESATQERPLAPSSASGSAATIAGTAVGTPAYMSPEQAVGDLDALGPRSDVYSLGATLYALLTGRAPFEGTDVSDVLKKVQRGEFPAPRAVRPEVPRPLEAACLKAMALRPEDRYPSPRALADDLEHWLADEPVSAWREPRSIRLRRWVRRHPRLVSGGAAGVLMALAATAALATVITAANRTLADANGKIGDRNRRITAQNGQLARTNRDLDESRAEAVRERDQSEAVTDFLVESFRSPDPERDGRTVTIAEVLARAVEELNDRDEIAPTTRASILDAVGGAYRGLGLVTEAVDVLEVPRDIRLQELGADHPDTLLSQNNLAFAYKSAGRLDEAVPLFEQTLEARRATLGTDHPDTLISQLELAGVYQAAGRLDEAIPLFERTLETQRATLGTDHAHTLISQNNLAHGYRLAGRLDEAISLYQRTLEPQRAKLGADHPDTLATQNNLAQAFEYAGRLDEAIPLKVRTLEARRAKLGDDHPDTLLSQHNLATAHEAAGRLDEAIPLFERTWEARRAKLGADHPDTLLSQSSLATAFGRAGRLDEAIPLLEAALEARRAKLGGDHPATLMSQNNLAFFYSSANRLGEAIPLFQRTLEARLTKLGADHPDTLASQNNLASTLYETGRIDEAIPLLERTLESLRAKLGDDHPDTLIARNNLATIYATVDRFDEAIPLLEQTLVAQRVKLGDLHPMLHQFRRNLAGIYESADREADAERVAREMTEAAGRRVPRDDKDYSEALALLGSGLIHQRRFAESEAPLRESLEIREQSQPETWTTAETRSLLGEAIAELGRFDEAEPLLLDGERGLAERAEAIPAESRDLVEREALTRLVALYEAWGKPDQAAEWRLKLPAAEPSPGASHELPADPFARARAGPEMP